jgi:phage repressor protein C with HTH and peptisase S24 domain
MDSKTRSASPPDSAIGDRLRSLRGQISQARFAALIDVSPRSVYRYELGFPMPTDVLLRVCGHVGCRPDWLLLGIGSAQGGGGTTREDTSWEKETWMGGVLHRDVPVLVRAPARGSQPSADQDTPTGISAEGHLVVPDPEDENAFALIVEGSSMSPILVPGDAVVVSPRRKEDLRLPITVIRIRGGDVAMRYLDIEGDHVVLSSENPEYRPIKVPLADIETVGRVVGWMHTIKE